MRIKEGGSGEEDVSKEDTGRMMAEGVCKMAMRRRKEI
jgi:hypothetical protein